MAISWAQDALAVLSGSAVGFSLGLIGGGGSILAVPLLLYVVGSAMRMSPSVQVRSPSRLTLSLICSDTGGPGMLNGRCAITFAVSGIVGAAVGSTLGKLVDGQQLLFLFALIMIAVGVVMLLPRSSHRQSGRPPDFLGHHTPGGYRARGRRSVAAFSASAAVS